MISRLEEPLGFRYSLRQISVNTGVKDCCAVLTYNMGAIFICETGKRLLSNCLTKNGVEFLSILVYPFVALLQKKEYTMYDFLYIS